MKNEFNTFDCEYMRIAKDPHYLYIYLAIDYGWSNLIRMYMFLYDTSTHELKCCIDDREIGEFRLGIVKDSYKEIGSIIAEDDVNIEEMFSFKEIPCKWYDAGSYTLFLMSGSKIKYFSIDAPELSSYQPFLWIIEHAKWIEETGAIRRYGIELRELIHSKFCRCLISNRPTDGEKCILCNRRFHDFPLLSKDANIVSLSIMTYIELYGITDVCYHITIYLDSKMCSCIKVSENNVESVIKLSKSLINMLTLQDNINELLKGKWIKEIENCLYDGNYYDYIIQQGNKFKRYSVACGFVEYWPLFERITKELYPYMTNRMMY